MTSFVLMVCLSAPCQTEMESQWTMIARAVVQQMADQQEHDAAVYRQIQDLHAQILLLKKQIEQDREQLGEALEELQQAKVWMAFYDPLLSGRKKHAEKIGASVESKPLLKPLVKDWGLSGRAMDWCKCSRCNYYRSTIKTDLDLALEDLK